MAHDADPTYVLAAGIIFPVLSIVTVVLRFYTRRLQNVGIGTDDWLLIPALLMVVGCGLCLIIGVSLRTLAYPVPSLAPGESPSTTPSWNFTIVEQLEWSFFLMQITAMGLTKLSFVFFYRRVFGGNKINRAFHLTSLAAIIILIVWMVAFFLWFLLSCASDFEARWTTVATLHAACPSDIQSDLALAISDVITDVMVIFLPIPMIFRLQMNVKRKLLVFGIFGLGAISIVASIIRLALFVMILKIGEGLISDPTADDNLLTTQGLYWSMLESGFALISCCLPTVYGLTKSPRLVSLVRSMRGLGSTDSRSGRRQGPRESPRGQVDNHLASDSVEAIVPGHGKELGNDSYATGGVFPPASEVYDGGKGRGIWVDRSIELQSKHV